MKKVVSKFLQSLLTTALLAAMAGCGVKGQPLPPLEPAPIGTGRPAALPKKDDKKNTQKR